MAIARIFILAIIVIVSTFTPAYTTETKIANENSAKYTADQLVGLWHFIAELNIESSVTQVQCRTMNISMGENQLEMSSHVIFDGEIRDFAWRAKVADNKLYNYQLGHDNSNPTIDSFDLLEDKGLLVLYTDDGAQTTVIYSRTTNITEELLREYKIMASIDQLYLHYGDNRNCRPRSIAQWRFDIGDAYRMTGIWYMVLGVCPKVLSYESSCAYMNITKGPEEFLKIYTYKEHGTIKYMRNWSAKIFYSELYEMNTKFLNPPSFSISYFNGGDEMYFHSKANISCDAIWSRNKHLSNESHARYKHMAQKKGWLIREIGHLVCE